MSRLLIFSIVNFLMINSVWAQNWQPRIIVSPVSSVYLKQIIHQIPVNGILKLPSRVIDSGVDNLAVRIISDEKVTVVQYSPKVIEYYGESIILKGRGKNLQEISIFGKPGSRIQVSYFRVGKRLEEIAQGIAKFLSPISEAINGFYKLPNFDVIVAPCYEINAYSFRPTIVLCSELVNYFIEHDIFDGLLGVLVHEYAHSLLYSNGSELYRDEDLADLIAAMFLGNPKIRKINRGLSDYKKFFELTEDNVSEFLAALQGDRHSFSRDRIRNVDSFIQNYDQNFKKLVSLLGPYVLAPDEERRFIGNPVVTEILAAPLSKCLRFEVDGRNLTASCIDGKAIFMVKKDGAIVIGFPLDDRGDYISFAGEFISMDRLDMFVMRISDIFYHNEHSRNSQLNLIPAAGQCGISIEDNNVSLVDCMAHSSKNGIGYSLSAITERLPLVYR